MLKAPTNTPSIAELEKIPCLAKDVIMQVQKFLKLRQPILHLAGLDPVILYQKPKAFHQTEASVDHQLTKLFMQNCIKKAPFLSQCAHAQLKQSFVDHPGLNIFQQPDLLVNLQLRIQQLRVFDRKNMITWLRKNTSYRSNQQQTITIRIRATPNLSINQSYCWFKEYSAFENLNLLHAMLAELNHDSIPEQLMGYAISDTWTRQYLQARGATNGKNMPNHRRAMAAIDSFRFQCAYFTIQTYRNVDDIIIFSKKSSSTIQSMIDF